MEFFDFKPTPTGTITVDPPGGTGHPHHTHHPHHTGPAHLPLPTSDLVSKELYSIHAIHSCIQLPCHHLARL